jgi:hypothetical protein
MFMGVVDGACALAAGSAAVPMALPAAVTAVAAALSTVAAALSSAAAALLEEAAATAVLFEAAVAVATEEEATATAVLLVSLCSAALVPVQCPLCCSLVAVKPQFSAATLRLSVKQCSSNICLQDKKKAIFVLKSNL